MALIGAILGDISGTQYEFDRPSDWKNCELFTEKCYFYDDTVMSLAIKHALDTGRDYAPVMQELGRLYPKCGFGGMFYGWIFDDKAEPYGSYGNGAAMRCFYESDSYISFLRNVYSIDSDADTLAAIAGGVAEEFYSNTGLNNDKILEYYLDERMLSILKS